MSDQTTEAILKQCTRCILDSNDDPAMLFNEQGVCSYCVTYDQHESEYVRTGQENELDDIVARIKKSGHGNRYDCILGLSGGVDSSYLALKASQLKLRPLIVHFDNGWNSELAVGNIESIIKKLNFDLHTLVVDWDEFKNLQLAFLRASVVDIEMVTDHAIIATLYKLAARFNIKYILSGTNYVTEAILPSNWIHPKSDYVHIQALQKKFIGKPFKTYPLYDLKTRFIASVKNVQSVSILNYLDYNKDKVKKELTLELEWRDYGGKHYESVFTRFYQGYILPTKFKIDKRKAHLSTLICSGQLEREQAMIDFAKPVYDEDLLRKDYDFVLKKLGLTPYEFDVIMNEPILSHYDYPTEVGIYDRFPFLKLVRPAWQWFKSKL